MIWYGMVWYGMIWCDMIRYDMIWYDMIWDRMGWVGWDEMRWDKMWCDMIWHDTTRHDITWHGMVYWTKKKIYVGRGERRVQYSFSGPVYSILDGKAYNTLYIIHYSDSIKQHYCHSSCFLVFLNLALSFVPLIDGRTTGRVVWVSAASFQNCPI